ncbi:MAG: hypothetical protein IKU68_06460 [Oscillospiraceae bacterium]|nr:hypothetical protein [Oscillospiraceae bacterium]
MMNVLMIALFLWLFFKAVGLAFRMAWGVVKLTAVCLVVFAVPLLVVGLIFTGGLLLLIPIALVAGAVALMANCI